MMRWRFDEPLQLEGDFWTAEDGRRFYGRLQHSRDGTQVHLHNNTLIAGYGAPPRPVYDALYGETADAGAVTLLDLHPTRWSSRGDSANTIDGVVETVVAGAHLPTLAGVHPHAISITIHGLLETFAGVWPESGMLSVQGGPHCRGESADVDLADGIRLEVGVSAQPDLHRGQEVLTPATLGSACTRLVRPAPP